MRILSLFDCNLHSLIDILPDVKDQGFDAIQISPLQNTKNDYSNEWWMLYQPINFEIGNRLGNIDILKKLCDKARENNLIIIVDVVVNHLAATDEYNSLNPNPKCDKDILYNNECWKEKINITNWNDRYQVTHYCMGLPGLNPNSKIVQEKIINMLNKYIECGVEGFRFDAAKSIALPEEGCDFFRNITFNLKKWLPIIYGEVLFSDKELIQMYAKYMKVLTNSDAYKKEDIIKFVENKDSYLSNDLSYTRNIPVREINNWYSNLAEFYPNTLYYARNYSYDWYAWKSNEVRKSNLKLVK